MWPDLRNVTVFCFLASYCVAFGAEWLRLGGRSAWRWARPTTLAAAVAGFVAHTIYLLLRSQSAGLPPLLSSTHDWLLVLAWLAILSYLMLTTLDRDLAVGVFVLPLVLLMVATAYFSSQAPNRRLDSLYGWKMLHASLLVLGMLGVLVGLVLALMYLFQQRRLRRGQVLSEGFGIPNLEKLARLNRWAVIVSVPLLTLGMATGVGLSFTAGAKAESLNFNDPVILSYTAVWVVMCGQFLWLMTTRRPTGRQVALLTVWSAGFLLATLIGLQILTGKQGLHVESWHSSVMRKLHAPGIAGAAVRTNSDRWTSLSMVRTADPTNMQMMQELWAS